MYTDDYIHSLERQLETLKRAAIKAEAALYAICNSSEAAERARRLLDEALVEIGVP